MLISSNNTINYNYKDSLPPIKAGIQSTHNSSALAFLNAEDTKKNHKLLKLIKNIFTEVGYFSYDFFLIATESFEKLAQFAAKYTFLKPIFMGIEGLCLLLNVEDKISHAHKKHYSKERTIIEVVGEALSGILLGLVLPDKIISFTQNIFAAKSIKAKSLCSLLAILGIECLMLISSKLTEYLAEKLTKPKEK